MNPVCMTQGTKCTKTNMQGLMRCRIADALSTPSGEITAENVKKKINNMRSQFNHECNKTKELRSGMGTDDMYEPTVWWFEKLSFLKQYIKSRKGKSNVEIDNSQVSTDELLRDDSQENTTTSWDEILTLPVEGTPLSSTVEGVSGKRMAPIESDTSTPSTSGRAKAAHKKNKIAVEDDAVISATLATLQNIQDSHGRLLHQENQIPRPNSTYGAYVAQELDSIGDAQIQNEAKHEINNILYRYKNVYLQSMTKT